MNRKCHRVFVRRPRPVLHTRATAFQLLWLNLPAAGAQEVAAFPEAAGRAAPTLGGAGPSTQFPIALPMIGGADEGRGGSIDDECEAGGDLDTSATRRSFDPADWRLNTMSPKRPDVLGSAERARST